MKELVLTKQNGQYVMDSRDGAEVTGKQHKNLMRDIQNYTNILLGSNLSLVE